jgi:hypothetical protein
VGGGVLLGLDLEGVGQLVVGHAGLPPGLAQVALVVLGGLEILFVLVHLLGLHVEVGDAVQNLLGLGDPLVARVLSGLRA